MGMGDTREGDEAPLGFSSDTLDQVQALWSPLTAGVLLARVGRFLRIMSQMMEEVGYLTEVLSRGHREVPPHHDSTTLMQRGKRPQPATQRDAPVRKLEVQYRGRTFQLNVNGGSGRGKKEYSARRCA